MRESVNIRESAAQRGAFRSRSKVGFGITRKGRQR